MSETQNKITNALIDDTNISTNVQIVANTYQRISFDKLTKLLSLLNAQVNQKLFRYYKKKKFKDKRIAFYCYHERVENNVHSNIILKVPPNYDVLNVLILMRKFFKKMNPKFELYYDLNVRNEFKCTDYATKEYNPEREDKYITI